MEIILTASPFENPICLFLNLKKKKRKKKKKMTNSAVWRITTSLMWSHPLMSLNLIPNIFEVTHVIQSTVGKYFVTVVN